MADKWDDERIENLLNDFPDIEDERTKEQVHAKLFSPEKSRQPKRWPSYLIAAVVFMGAAGLLFAMLTSNNAYDLTSDTSMSEDSADSSNEVYQQSESAEETGADSATSAEEESLESGDADTSMTLEERTAVYSSDLEGHTLFTLGLTENAFVVPVTFLIPSSEVEGEGAVALYEQFAPLVDEAALGFDEYHPYAGSLTADGSTIEHRLPEAHSYDLASASVNVYLESLLATFGEAEAIRILDAEGAPAEFDGVGQLEDIARADGGVPFYQFTISAGSSFLVPDWNGDYETAAEALLALSSSPNDLQQATVPAGVVYTVDETDEQLVVRFESLDLGTLAPADAMRMIESMALTAGSFGKELLLENIVQSEWGGFNFALPLPVPVAPNRMNWTP